MGGRDICTSKRLLELLGASLLDLHQPAASFKSPCGSDKQLPETTAASHDGETEQTFQKINFCILFSLERESFVSPFRFVMHKKKNVGGWHGRKITSWNVCFILSPNLSFILVFQALTVQYVMSSSRGSLSKQNTRHWQGVVRRAGQSSLQILLWSGAVYRPAFTDNVQ